MKIPTKQNGQIWDWEKFKSEVSPEAFEFHFENWEKPVSQQEYVLFDTTRKHTGKHKPPCHRIKDAKYQYKRLKNNWGFFATPSNFLD